MADEIEGQIDTEYTEPDENELFDYGEPDTPTEPESWHNIDMTTQTDGSIWAWHTTNDNLDKGYQSEHAAWETTHASLEAAFKVNGKSRHGMACVVNVTLDGHRI